MKKFIIILSAATATAAAVTILVTAILVSIKKPDTPPVLSSDYMGQGSFSSKDDFDITSSIISSGAEDESTPTISMPINTLTPAPKLEYSKGGKSVKTGVSLDRLYDENSLTTTQKDESYRGIRMWLGELDGLKDAQIESKINQNISDTLRSFIDKVIAEHEKVTYSEAIIYRGFANIISVSYNVYDGEDYHYKYHTYNLCDGLPVSLEDIFVDGADYAPIINGAFYREITRLSVGDDDAEYDDNKNIIPNINVEYETYRLMQQYFAQNIHEVGFSAGSIYFSCGTVLASLETRYIADKLAIYDRFKTDKSIFEDDSVGKKGLITCRPSSLYDGMYTENYGYLESNLWYDTAVIAGNSGYDDILYKRANEKLKEYRSIAKKNPNKAYIVMQKWTAETEGGVWGGSIGQENYSSIIDNIKQGEEMMCIENIVVLEMSKQFFDKEFKTKLYDTYRDGHVPVMVDGAQNGEFGIVVKNPKLKEVTYSEKAYISRENRKTGAVIERKQIDIINHRLFLGGI